VIVWDERKREINLRKHGLDFADAHLVYENPDKLTTTYMRNDEERKMDVALVEVRGVILALVYLTAAWMCELSPFASRLVGKGNAMSKPEQSKTDWDRVKKAYDANAPIPYDSEDGPYDPNDETAVDAYWDHATITYPGRRGPQKAPTKRLISLRLSQEVVDHYKSLGAGWQTRIDEALKKSIAPKRRKKAS